MTRFIVVVHDFDFHDFTISGIYTDYERALERFFYEIGNEFTMAITIGCKKNSSGSFDLTTCSKGCEEIDFVDGKGKTYEEFCVDDLTEEIFNNGGKQLRCYIGESLVVELSESTFDTN